LRFARARNLTPIEHEVSGDDNRRYLIRLRPYYTPDDKIEGVIAIFLDVGR
jgi:hypothetical protein